jgi:hypothetical protein
MARGFRPAWVCEHGSGGVSIVESHNQATPSENYDKTEQNQCVFYRGLYSVITSYKSPVNPVDNSNPVSGH